MSIATAVHGDKRNVSVFPGLATESFGKRAWRRADIASGRYQVFYDLTDAARQGIEAIRRKNIHLGIVEPDDFRVPLFARDVPQIRRRLDTSGASCARRHLWPGTDPVDLDAAEYDGGRADAIAAMAL